MKRICSSRLALLLCLVPLALPACGSGAIDNPAALAEALADNTEMYSTEIYPLDESLLAQTFGVTAAYTAAYGYATAGDAADEIAVFVAADEAGAKTILTQLQTHQTDFSALYATYAADQCPRIEGALLQRVGTVVVWCISNDTAKAETIVKNYTK